MDFTLEIGKSYRHRDGTGPEKIVSDGRDVWPMRGLSGNDYSRNGRFVSESVEDPRDLVELFHADRSHFMSNEAETILEEAISSAIMAHMTKGSSAGVVDLARAEKSRILALGFIQKALSLGPVATHEPSTPLTEEWFIIKFDDADEPDIVVNGRDDAVRIYHAKNGNWNIHLFQETTPEILLEKAKLENELKAAREKIAKLEHDRDSTWNTLVKVKEQIDRAGAMIGEEAIRSTGRR